MSVVLDTHAAVWYALGSSRLSVSARAAIDEAVRTGVIYLPAISVVEIVYLVEKGRLPQEALDRLLRLLRSGISPVQIAPLDLRVAEALQHVPRAEVPDMPDRVIAATVLRLGLPLVTRDRKIQLAPVHTIWRSRGGPAPGRDPRARGRSAFRRPPATAHLRRARDYLALGNIEIRVYDRG